MGFTHLKLIYDFKSSLLNQERLLVMTGNLEKIKLCVLPSRNGVELIFNDLLVLLE